MNKNGFREFLSINAYWFGMSFMWNSLHVLILPALLLNFVPDSQKNTYLGLLTFFGLIIAMVVQPISGAASDRWRSRWGKRRPLIFIGTIFDFIFLAIIGGAGGMVWLVIGYLGLQLSSNVAHGPLQGLLPDRVTSDKMGRASGIKNVLEMAGLIVSSLWVGRALDPDVGQAWNVILLLIGILGISSMITIFGVREKPSLKATNNTGKEHWLDAFRVDIRANRNYFRFIVSRLFFLISIYGVQTFAQYYIRDVLSPANPVQLTGDLLAAITLALVVFSVAGGWLGDRWGHKQINYLSGAIGAAGCFLLLWARTPALLLIFGAVFGIGIGMFLTSNWALAMKLAPPEQAGKFLGLTNLATAGAAAISRLGGPGIDLLNNASPGAWQGYTGLFIVGSVSILISLLLLRKVPEPALSQNVDTAVSA